MAIYAFVIQFSTIENNEFSKSAIFSESKSCPTVIINNSRFISNIGEQGTIYHKVCDEIKNREGPPVTFESCNFENNIAREYGGVLFYDQINPNDSFTNCTFHNNTAPIGT